MTRRKVQRDGGALRGAPWLLLRLVTRMVLDGKVMIGRERVVAARCMVVATALECSLEVEDEGGMMFGDIHGGFDVSGKRR